MSRLKGEIAIITGGSRGLGAALVERFVAEGANVVTCGLDQEEGRATVERVNRLAQAHPERGARAEFVVADVGRVEDPSRLVEQTVRLFGPPTILVNNAAMVVLKAVQDASPEEVRDTLHVNVRACWLMARAVFPYLKQRRGGVILNVASTHPLQTRPDSFPYNMSKGAILALNKAMAVDFGPFDIRVNALLPGIMETQPTLDWLARFRDPEAKRAEVLGSHALPRLPTPQEVANAAVFLASSEASAITGAEVIVDCGRQAKRP